MGSPKTFFWEDLPPEKLWYLIGLITSDGSLSKDGRHIDITSKDFSLLQNIKRELLIPNRITEKSNGRGQKAFRIQIGSISLYEFIRSIGLTPNKSRKIGKLKIPESNIVFFLRGLIDGDGCIRNWIHPTNKKEQWSLRIYSGSEVFLIWLRKEIINKFGARGEIYKNDEKYNCYALKFGKMAAQEILSKCYGDNSLALLRKKMIADQCIATKRGWSKSKTTGLNTARVAE